MQKKSSVKRKLSINKFTSKACKAEVSVDKEQENENINDAIQAVDLMIKGMWYFLKCFIPLKNVVFPLEYNLKHGSFVS